MFAFFVTPVGLIVLVGIFTVICIILTVISQMYLSDSMGMASFIGVIIGCGLLAEAFLHWMLSDPGFAGSSSIVEFVLHILKIVFIFVVIAMIVDFLDFNAMIGNGQKNKRYRN